MNTMRFKISITKLLFASLLITPIFMTNIQSAHASLTPLMFGRQDSLAKFTYGLIHKSLHPQNENSFNNEDSKKDSKKFWIRINAIAKHF